MQDDQTPDEQTYTTSSGLHRRFDMPAAYARALRLDAEPS